MDETDRVLVDAIKILIREDVESFLKDGIVLQERRYLLSVMRNKDRSNTGEAQLSD